MWRIRQIERKSICEAYEFSTDKNISSCGQPTIPKLRSDYALGQRLSSRNCSQFLFLTPWKPMTIPITKGMFAQVKWTVIIVALNYQTKTEPMFLNQALFQLNGGSGFILKPPYMRNNESIYDVMKGKLSNDRCYTSSISHTKHENHVICKRLKIWFGIFKMKLGLHRKNWKSLSFLVVNCQHQNEIWSILMS